ncbi:hypothetical protein POVCU2_0032100 [Plasmodium ovale curtisi]|uniref:Uncharacterized protein n=1 Tax=Plasmodium ovale curtisi TaxID=864141 RepID=A0A1A8WRH6_PLAOA|nr:hypothetical protein POVCU2_0032100 [Plasmodium ovale curtisi]SBS95517.1 hypothetical protein POVCU1_029730 [Plasmodium ovale curtisi]
MDSPLKLVDWDKSDHIRKTPRSRCKPCQSELGEANEHVHFLERCTSVNSYGIEIVEHPSCKVSIFFSRGK